MFFNCFILCGYTINTLYSRLLVEEILLIEKYACVHLSRVNEKRKTCVSIIFIIHIHIKDLMCILYNTIFDIIQSFK